MKSIFLTSLISTIVFIGTFSKAYSIEVGGFDGPTAQEITDPDASGACEQLSSAIDWLVSKLQALYPRKNQCIESCDFGSVPMNEYDACVDRCISEYGAKIKHLKDLIKDARDDYWECLLENP